MNWQTISPHFTHEEIFSPDILRARAFHLVDIEMLRALNKAREIINAPCFVNHKGFHLRGVVSAREVALRQGASLTTHVTGKTVDVSCYSITIDELAEVLKQSGFKHIIKYRSWCHAETIDRSLI